MIHYEESRLVSGYLHDIRFAYKIDDKSYNANHYVNWSGGTDSTLLLYELLKEYGPNHVRAITWKYPYYSSRKYELEKEKREAFKEFLAKEKLNGFRHVEMTVTQDNSSIKAINGGNPQACGWLMTIPLYMDNGDYFYDSSILDDDLVIRNDSLIKTVKYASEILDRDITFRQPYIRYRKSDIISKLVNYGIYDYTWFCEMPEDDGICCMCNPCRLHISSLCFLNYCSPFEDIRDFANEKSKEFCNRRIKLNSGSIPIKQDDQCEEDKSNWAIYKYANKK